MPLRALRRLGWFRVLLAAELLVALAVSGGLWLLHRQTLQAEGRLLAALARAKAMQADRTLDVGATVLRTTGDELARALLHPTSADTAALLRERLRALPGYAGLGLFDMHGRALAGSGVAPAAAEAVVAAVRTSAPGQVVLAELPPPSDGGQAAAALAMGWGDGGRPLQGVIVLVAGPGWLDEDGMALAPGAGGIGQRVVRADGRPLPGTRPPAAGSPGAAAPALQAPAVPVRLSDGSHAWLLVAQPLAALPLVQLVWLDLDAALASWSELAWMVGAFVTAMVGVTFGFGLRLARDQLRVEGLEARLQRSRKLEAIGQLAGGVAHDFNNVLAAVAGFGELAREDATAGSRQARHLDQVLQAADRGRQQVERILAFSRGQPRRQIVFLLQPLLQEVLDHLAPAAGTAVRIERDLRAPDLALRGDPGAVYEAVMNLCTNALQAMPDGGRLKVTLDDLWLKPARAGHGSALTPGRYARVRVQDNGHGMTPQVQARLFEPFYTTRSRGGGTGIGLAVVHGVVQDMGGDVDVASAPGQGSCFTLRLPACDERPDVDAPAELGLPLGHGQSVLVVDDEAALVELAEEMLAGLGYEPLGTTSAEHALAAFLDDPDRYQLLLADELMPGMTGTELAQRLRARRPELPVVLATGHGGGRFDERVARAGVQVVLAKPFSLASLARAVHEALRRSLQL